MNSTAPADLLYTTHSHNTYTDAGWKYCRFRYERFHQFLASVHGDMRKETQFLKDFANHTMLTPSQLVMSKISVGRDPKNPTTSFNGQNPTLNGRIPNSRLNGIISTDVFSKSSNSQDHLFRARRHPHSSPIFCLGVYYDKWLLSYPLRASVKLHPMTMHLDLRNSNSSKPY